MAQKNFFTGRSQLYKHTNYTDEEFCRVEVSIGDTHIDVQSNVEVIINPSQITVEYEDEDESVTDRLRNLKQLLDDNIINYDEFEQKKKQLLELL